MTASAFCHHLLGLKIIVAALTMLKKKKKGNERNEYFRLSLQETKGNYPKMERKGEAVERQLRSGLC